MPGGDCGFLGFFGASSGEWIFASIISEATPLTAAEWEIPQRLTAECLQAMVAVGGPRCCKRTGRLCIKEAAAYTAEHFGIEMPLSDVRCTYMSENRECIGRDCPFFPYKKEQRP